VKEDSLPDIDDAMQSFLDSDEYQNQRHLINEMTRCLRAGLNPEQRSALRQLLDEIYLADRRYSEEAFSAGLRCR